MKTLQLLLLTMISTALMAQSDVGDRELTVKKSYNNEIYEVNPIFDYAAILVPERTMANFDFDSLSSVRIQTPDIDMSVQPLAFQTQRMKSGRTGFIKLDKGTTNPLHAQGGYTLSKPNYYNLHFLGNYDHRSVTTTPLMETKNIMGSIGLDYYLTKDIKLNAHLNYDQHKNGLYSTYAPMTDDPERDYRSYNNKGITLGVKTIKTSPRKWNFGLQTNANQWTQYDTKEYNINTIGAVNLRFNDSWGLALAPFHTASISSTTDNQDVMGSTLHILMDTKRFYSKLGAKLNYFDDQIHLWPSVDIRWNVGKETELYITADAQAEILGGQALTQINPYTSDIYNTTRQTSLSNQLKLDVYSSVSAKTDLAFSMSYLKALNHINFVPGAQDKRTFDVEAVDYDRLQVSTKLTREITPILSASLMLEYNNYTKNMTQLLHRPVVVAEPIISAKLLNNKLMMSIHGKFNDAQHILSATNEVETTGWRKNISFTAGWDIADQLRIHANVDNILNDDYQIWSGYQTFERNISGGLLFTF